VQVELSEHVLHPVIAPEHKLQEPEDTKYPDEQLVQVEPLEHATQLLIEEHSTQEPLET
jgi:hypothetical protein